MLPTDKASVLLQLPIITRFYITLSFFTTAACALEVSHQQAAENGAWKQLTA